jgi:hypothetical protein
VFHLCEYNKLYGFKPPISNSNDGPPQSDVFILCIRSKETQRKARFKTRIYSVSTLILYCCGLSFGYENTLGICYEILYPNISVSVQNPT